MPFNFKGESQLNMAIILAVIGFIFILFLEKLATKKEI